MCVNCLGGVEMIAVTSTGLAGIAATVRSRLRRVMRRRLDDTGSARSLRASTIEPQHAEAKVEPMGEHHTDRSLPGRHGDWVWYALAFAVYVPAGVVLQKLTLNWVVGLVFPVAVIHLLPRLFATPTRRMARVEVRQRR